MFGKLASSTRNHGNNVGTIENKFFLPDTPEFWISTPKECYKALLTIKVVG